LKTNVVAVILVLLIAASATVGYFVGVAGQRTVTSVSTTTTTTTGSLTVPVINSPTMNVNGSLYYADNVSMDISVGNPGYSYFHNGSVTFLGVKFETYCPPSYGGCPLPAGVTETKVTTVTIGLIRLNATFPDKSTETIDGLIGTIDYFYVFSHHSNPQAGILIVYSNGYKAYLLVS